MLSKEGCGLRVTVQCSIALQTGLRTSFHYGESTRHPNDSSGGISIIIITIIIIIVVVVIIFSIL